MVGQPAHAEQRLQSEQRPQQWQVSGAEAYPPAEERLVKYAAGAQIHMGEHIFCCQSVLGRGSYGEVWRAQVLQGPAGLSQVALKEVALKEVACGSQSELQQAIFEVQVLLALERAADAISKHALRVPRCICYKVGPCNSGWKVRTAMTVVPGESLDFFVCRAPPLGRTRKEAVSRGCALAEKLIRDVSPMLQLLQPIAWHRDVNSHNVLIDGAPEDASVEELSRTASFWLIDFGLAVDSQSWVTSTGKWRSEYIGGDSRYWPLSSWIMHLYGPEGLDDRPMLCDQYQNRLDVHGLAITALELLCSVAQGGEAAQDSSDPWTELLQAWNRYHHSVYQWWSEIYRVFSVGGDIAPVQAKLVDEQVVQQLVVLLSNIRCGLRRCSEQHGGVHAREGVLLSTLADMLDEGLAFNLGDVDKRFGQDVDTSEAEHEDLATASWTPVVLPTMVPVPVSPTGAQQAAVTACEPIAEQLNGVSAHSVEDPLPRTGAGPLPAARAPDGMGEAVNSTLPSSAEVRERRSRCQADFTAKLKQLEACGQQHLKLQRTLWHLEESLTRLSNESLARAKEEVARLALQVTLNSDGQDQVHADTAAQ